MIRKFFGALFMIWAGIIFLVTMLIFWIPMWATKFIDGEARRTKIFLDVVRVWMKFFLPLCGIRFTVKGKEHFKKGENYVVVCNHKSYMDVPLSCPAIPGANKTIAKREFVDVPVFGMIYSRGSVLVDRNSEASRKDSYHQMKKVLDMGMHMSIYPEGTRNRTGHPLKSFQDGAFRLAHATKKSIIPAILLNTAKVLPPEKKFYFWPHPVAIHFLEPIPVNDEDTPETLKEKTFRIMYDYIEKEA
ncbi:MAG TPA: lysophospholipid acyltransferase family protein [Chitinophagaceae bacterium]|nr:lysophospholipid acyltransferase family protein [Chitinophagaceae bacterium]